MSNIEQNSLGNENFSDELIENSAKPNGLLLKIIIYALLFSVTLPFTLYSQKEGGGYSEPYIFRNVGARPVAMAGAYTAIVNEPFGMFYNPAGLGYLSPMPTISTSVSTLSFGRTHASLAWGQQVMDNLGVGMGINSLFSGAFTARDIKGNPKGTYSDFQYTFNAAASYNIEFVSMGVSMKYFTENLRGSPTCANGYAIDIGTKFDIMNMISVGVAIQNVSGMMLWNTPYDNYEKIPFVLRTGVAMEFGLNEQVYEARSTVTGEMETVYVPATRYVLVGIDAHMTENELTPDFILGLEVAAHEMVVFRGGMTLYGDRLGTPQFLPMTTWGGGVSFRPKLEDIIEGLPFKSHIDYTISNEHITHSGIAHHVSLMFEF